MDRILRTNREEGVLAKVIFLLFVDEVVLLASSSYDLQHTLEQFVAECEARMKVSSSKSEAVILNWKKV